MTPKNTSKRIKLSNRNNSFDSFTCLTFKTQPNNYTRLASNVISIANALLTGQFAFAPFVIS